MKKINDFLKPKFSRSLSFQSSKLGKEKSEGEGQSSSSGKTSADGSSKGANGTSAGNGSAAGPNLTEKQAKTAAVLSSAKVDTPSTSSELKDAENLETWRKKMESLLRSCTIVRDFQNFEYLNQPLI